MRMSLAVLHLMIHGLIDLLDNHLTCITAIVCSSMVLNDFPSQLEILFRDKPNIIHAGQLAKLFSQQSGNKQGNPKQNHFERWLGPCF